MNWILHSERRTMRNGKRNLSILGLCDSMIHMLSSLRCEYLAQTASLQELMCGEWVCADSTISYRIYEKEDSYMIEKRYGNLINNRVKCYLDEILEDENGNLYTKEMERALGYDRDRDVLLIESYGEFQRKKE